MTVSDIINGIDDIASNAAKVRFVEKESTYTLAKLYNQACFIDSFHKNLLFVHHWNKTDKHKLQALSKPHLKHIVTFKLSIFKKMKRLRLTFTLNG